MRKISLLLFTLLVAVSPKEARPGVLTPPRLLRVVRPYDVRHYRLNVRLDPRTGAYETRTAITFQAAAPMSVMELDAVGLTVTGAWLVPEQGTGEREPIVTPATPERGERAPSLPFQVKPNPADEIQGTLRVVLPVRLNPGSLATVEIVSSSVARKEQSGFFMVRDPDHPQRGSVYLTHFQPLGARRFFPCHDDPGDKATFEVEVETDAKMQVLANGRRVSDKVLPGGRHKVRYSMPRPISTYLVGLAIGAFDQETLDEGSVPLDVFYRKGSAASIGVALTTARDALKTYERLFEVPYPYERYTQVEAPLFFAQLMENASLAFSSRSNLLLPTSDAQIQRLRISGAVANGLSRQWFGDLVTIRWWDDLWLTESLATWAATKYQSERYGLEGIQVRTFAELRDGYFRVDQGPRSHPLSNRDLPSLEDAFDPITHQKGAQVMRMVEELLGEERMASGISDFLRRFSYKNASYTDLLASLSEAQQGLAAPPRKGPVPVPDTAVGEFIRSWLEHRGHPIVSVGWRFDPARKETIITVRQRPSHVQDDVRWHVRLPIALNRRGVGRFAIEATLAFHRPVATFVIPTPSAPEWISWNRGGLALVEIETQPGTPDTELTLAAQSDPDPTTRLLALHQLSRPTPSGLEQLPALAKDSLVQALKADPSPYVRYHLAKRLSSMPGKLPEALGLAALQVAQSPGGIDPTDPLGVLLTRAGAIELLGKAAGDPPGRVLSAMVQDPNLPLDLVGPAALGLARRGDDLAIAALAKGGTIQKNRGFAYMSRVLSAYGAIGNPRHIREVARVVRESNQAPIIVGEVLRGLFYNEDLRQSPDLPPLIAELILGTPELDEDLQARALIAMEGLRTREAKSVLESVKKKAKAARIRLLANLYLARTFG